ncbi:MAG: Uma2 family endonuclease [Rhizonema sp. PD38]|nr:Uma2 family endonuclease [Rhizonema sp. PD38]
MSSAQNLEIPLQDLSEDIIFPPGDLLSDEPPLETELHLRQMLLLIQCLEWWWRERQNFYACGNLTVYYSPRQRKSEQFRGPDFFVVLDTERKPRKSWVVWEEDGKYPHVIIEILSPKTADTDRGLKKQIYQDIWRTPNYFWFDPQTLEFKGFELLSGRYQELNSNENGWLWSQQLELYLGIYESKLRFFSPDGELIFTPEEAALKQQERADQEQQQRQQAEQRLVEMETILARYRERFGELSE